MVPNVILQHANDAAALADLRFTLARSARVDLPYLRRLDQRLRAHLDGLDIAGPQASPFCDAMLETPSSGALFTVAVQALRLNDEGRLNGLIALAQALPETGGGLRAAFGWVGRSWLEGVVARLLADDDPFRRMSGVAACAMHRVDIGRIAARLLQDASPMVRGRVIRTAGESGLQDMLPACVSTARADGDPTVQFWAAWSGVLLGDRSAALARIVADGFQPSPHRQRAFRLALQTMTIASAHAALQRLAADDTLRRWVIEGSGIVGDPAYVPWLLKQMDDPALARIAADAFSVITGLDLGAEALDRPAPEGFEAGPTDDPDDPNVETDPDDGLPWPDGPRIRTWWAENGRRFQAGTRYFMGAPVGRERCLDVLKRGYQRQRVLAAHHLCLLDPGTPLFNTSAPAWRQQRLLAAMS
jgi:uncharacterized protein (TIGR02270 family)